MHYLWRKFKGFTLIEILVAMVIVAIGLLGLGAIQVLSLKDNQDAYSYTQATALAYEMADRIRANAPHPPYPPNSTPPWRNATLPTPAADCNDNCNSSAKSCTAANMAAYDYCTWLKKAQAQINSNVTVTVSKSPVSDSTVCQGAAPKLCLRLSWPGSLQANSRFDFEIQP